MKLYLKYHKKKIEKIKKQLLKTVVFTYHLNKTNRSDNNKNR